MKSRLFILLFIASLSFILLGCGEEFLGALIPDTGGSSTSTIEINGNIVTTINREDGTVIIFITSPEGIVTTTTIDPDGSSNTSTIDPDGATDGSDEGVHSESAGEEIALGGIQTELGDNGETISTFSMLNIDGFRTDIRVVVESNSNITVTLTVDKGTEGKTITVTHPDGTRAVTLNYNGDDYICDDDSFTPIVTVSHLQNISLHPKVDYCLNNDINLTGNFEPIGDQNITYFLGTLDGQNKKVTGLSIDKENSNSVGIFRAIGETGEVKDLTIEDPSVKGRDVVGVLAGENGGTISNVSIQSSGASNIVEGNFNIGSLVGNNHGEITDSNSNGNVYGVGSVGGLVGTSHGEITSSSASGNVESSLTDPSAFNGVGGLVGINQGDIASSYASGSVTGTSYLGGLVGYGGNITSSYATGDVSASGENSNVGGLVGYGGNITSSYATGDVSASGENSNVGGLVGYGRDITSSYAIGDVSASGENSNVGGLVGYGGNITSSYATGDVSASGENSNVGGLVGSAGYGEIINSYATTGQVSGTGFVGGLVGMNDGGITSSYATGFVSGTGFVAGLVGSNYYRGTIENSYFDAITTEQPDGIAQNDNPDYEPNPDQPPVAVTAIQDVTTEITGGGKEPFETAGWDFSTVWAEQGDGEWPLLSWQ